MDGLTSQVRLESSIQTNILPFVLPCLQVKDMSLLNKENQGQYHPHGGHQKFTKPPVSKPYTSAQSSNVRESELERAKLLAAGRS